MTDQRISFRTQILRKQANLPRYVVIQPEHLRDRTKSFPAEILLNDIGPFRRNVHPWGKGYAVFFINLTEQQCRQARLDTNDECQVTITAMPT
ncbi:hypothetical protein [Aminobacter ciceronei]|uniref:Uncharacterized protein n=1 Tax=Aminobacter ciceronei TaxID=150723 RepID=A0ABR6C9Q1_9HYPH|nr:hypothetical protein [Aminobacter ciceronei]MBA8907984.1 hypothetical protein [Aminobacter ciceronei]MBA9021739.1 hypothetical protein [Aminobacter ciceronei]